MSDPTGLPSDQMIPPDLDAIRVKCDAYDDLLDEEEIRDLLDYVEWLLGELKALDLKWQFEHTLAVDQEAEIKRLDAEIAQLRSPASNPTWPNGERRRGYPAYEVPPADPLLANPIEKKRPARPQER
jgi:hypothetical protein